MTVDDEVVERALARLAQFMAMGADDVGRQRLRMRCRSWWRCTPKTGCVLTAKRRISAIIVAVDGAERRPRHACCGRVRRRPWSSRCCRSRCERPCHRTPPGPPAPPWPVWPPYPPWPLVATVRAVGASRARRPRWHGQRRVATCATGTGTAVNASCPCRRHHARCGRIKAAMAGHAAARATAVAAVERRPRTTRRVHRTPCSMGWPWMS